MASVPSSSYGKSLISKVPNGPIKVLSWHAQGKSSREIATLFEEEFGEKIAHSSVHEFIKKAEDRRGKTLSESPILQRQQTEEFLSLVAAFRETNEETGRTLSEFNDLIAEMKQNPELRVSEISSMFSTKLKILDAVLKQLQFNAKLMGVMETKVSKTTNVQVNNVFDLAPKIGTIVEGMKANRGLVCRKCRSTDIVYKEVRTEDILVSQIKR